jgi:formylglycine-generating enzyme required for sulfatase activity
MAANPNPKIDAATETWALIKDSQNPEDFEEFAKSYPGSDLALGARIRAAQLRRAAAPSLELARLPEPQAAPVGRTKLNANDGLTYVWIPAGTFTMGCSPTDAECSSDESPAHTVTISKAFWLGQTEVTQEAFERVMATNPSKFRGPKLPVEFVRWNDAQAFCEAVGMRLPSEAEWEYAARAGSTGSRYGDVGQVAWYIGNSGGQTHEVGQKQPNAWGLYDMLGNVWEWTADWYASYSASSQRDPGGPSGGTGRALRGGSYFLNARSVRASYRMSRDPVNVVNIIGLRCASN